MVRERMYGHTDAVLFCGINPGAESGAQRHHYAHRSNVRHSSH